MEGISQSILEAMSLGVPVIATNASGNPEIIQDNINGYLFEDNDIESLGNKIKALVRNQELRNKFSAAAKKTLNEKFSLPKTVNNYARLFDNLIRIS